MIDKIGSHYREPDAHNGHSLTDREKPIQFTQVRKGGKKYNVLLERGEGQDLIDPPAEGTVKRIELVHTITIL